LGGLFGDPVDQLVTSDSKKPSPKTASLSIGLPSVDRFGYSDQNVLSNFSSVSFLQASSAGEANDQWFVDRDEFPPCESILRGW
jgi:hypothetical protein